MPVVLEGTAASYDHLFIGNPMPFPIIIRPGSFSASLRTEGLMVVALVNHKGLPLASTLSAQSPLKLSETDEGLMYEATVNLDDADAALLVSKVDQDLVTEASVDVEITRASWIPFVDPLTELWGDQALEVTQMDIHRGDVTFTARGANPHTSTRIAASGAAAARRANYKVVASAFECVRVAQPGG